MEDAAHEFHELIQELKQALDDADLGDAGFIVSPVLLDGVLYGGFLPGNEWDEINLKSGVSRNTIETGRKLREENA